MCDEDWVFDRCSHDLGDRDCRNSCGVVAHVDRASPLAAGAAGDVLKVWTPVGQVVCLVALVGAARLLRHGGEPVERLIAVVVRAVFVVNTLGGPLGATKLYLVRIPVDQQFRTEYLTRLLDSPVLAE
ncbi:arabinofuranosyltransferase [Mycobacteroides abscessus]|uniref:arabinofuranosyltransferase n=1 Tax=Mycobacteroides abscessus TaxID=36809 RepID=UPI0009A6B505|nr:arabinofuranosyltransferase [Mycobacteroides abscessus]TXH19309.1 MAG: hypothetical protein E6R06_24720 [Mycobacterium sp.]